jgi:flagellar motor switch protein FliM
MSSAPPSAIYVVEVEELNQKIVLELDPRLVIFTIEKLFGGPGVFLRKPREVSQIERRIMSKVMQRAFRELEKPGTRSSTCSSRRSRLSRTRSSCRSSRAWSRRSSARSKS